MGFKAHHPLRLHVALGISLSAVALVLQAVAFGTEHWQDIVVNRAELYPLVTEPEHSDLRYAFYENMTFFSRGRGIFRVCIHDENEEEYVGSPDGACAYDEGIFLPARRHWGWHNTVREHTVRLHISLLMVSMVTLVVTLVSGISYCVWQSTCHLTTAGVAAQLAAVSSVGGMTVFHCYIYLEVYKITDYPFPAFWDRIQPLGLNSSWTYGYSFILGWSGSAVAIVTAFLFVVVGLRIRRSRKKENEKAPITQDQTVSELGSVSDIYQEQPSTIPDPSVVYGYNAASSVSSLAGYNVNARCGSSTTLNVTSVPRHHQQQHRRHKVPTSARTMVSQSAYPDLALVSELIKAPSEASRRTANTRHKK